MKKVLTLLALMFSFVAFSATVNWNVSNLTNSTGCVYLLQVTNGSYTIDSLKQHLNTYGTASNNTSDFNLLSSSTTIEEDVFSGALSVTSSFTSETGTLTPVFALLISGSNYEISSIFGTITVTDSTVPSTSENQVVFDDVATGVLGTTPLPGGVPEPTVLALLALGVAGLALKRKVA